MGSANGGSFGVLKLLLIFGALVAPNAAASERLDYFLQSHQEISQFFSLLRTSPYLKSAILWKQGTLFVPKNEAITNFVDSGKKITNTTLLYHFCNFAMPLSELEQERSISTELTGNSQIWITKTAKGLFLNDAKYLTGNFRVVIEDRDGQSSSATIVHIIDRVLEPTVPGSIESSYLHNPDAGKYMEHMSSYDSSNHQLASIYRDQVNRQQKMNLYKNPGFQTFFIPVDEAFKQQKVTLNSIDSKVMYGHIIPKTGIFLRTIEGGEEYETYRPPMPPTVAPPGGKGQPIPTAFTIMITFEKSSVDGRDIWLVNSDNRQGDDKHRKGVVQAEIIKGNIPVKNGVVHLISKPLVIIDLNAFQTLEWYATKQHVKSMWRFLELFRKLQINGLGQDIRSLLEGRGAPNGVTLFVPSNEAIENCSELQARQNNMTAIAEILKTHILREMVSAEDMIEHSKMKKFPFQVQSAAPGRKILFSSFIKDGDRTIHLEGGGVNATVTHADFGATNGFIHIIDRVLGLPDQTIQEKLRSHPMLQGTHQLWRKAKMDERLNLTSQTTLTFFAPSDRAWTNLRRISDSAHHNFFHGRGMDDLLSSVLERHIILDKVLSIEDLAELSLEPANKTMSKGLKGNWTVSRYPIATMGTRGYIKVNESKTLMVKADSSHTTTTPSPGDGKQKTTRVMVGDDSHYYIYWNRMWAHVIRTNVKCTNGMIQIIDDVLMDNEEITVAGAPGKKNKLFIIIPLGILSFLVTLN